MKTFIHSNFLLQHKIAERLFHEVADQLPVIDYHNHLNPDFLAENKRFENIAQMWVTSDQYKHRAMRINGIPENDITGNLGDKEKFMRWATTLPKTMGNPLFHWSAMELKGVFGIDKLLSPENAEEIWSICNAKLAEENLGMTEVLKKWKVETLCTSDDLLDDLTAHQQATATQSGLSVWPSLRSDSMLAFQQTGFKDWMQKLEVVSGIEIKNLVDYQTAILNRLDIFSGAGCRLSDHALDSGFVFKPTSVKIANALFQQVINEENLSPLELIGLQSYMLNFLGQEYAKRGWIMQLHIGAYRTTSSRLRNLAGPFGGFAGIGNPTDMDSLFRFIDSLDKNEALPQTIIYNLNPNDNAAFATLTGSFAEDGLAGKIQFGPAWWYNDHFEGILEQLKKLASFGMLSHFIGMTSDSRSVLSFSRHEYFRRVLCNMIGDWVAKGHLPDNFEWLAALVKGIAYENIHKRLKTELSQIEK
ncbi:glucuronate isomerase [Flexithrix dorotheae]|uniref:glucuronate isomerase n=1 Tax=Flexithrix dorotheae TaxID=70993 RepID=UPI00037DD545|nr:glucuronate isomerase [Flexithrix dorotheae]